jgi:hypothetical protein
MVGADGRASGAGARPPLHALGGLAGAAPPHFIERPQHNLTLGILERYGRMVGRQLRQR